MMSRLPSDLLQCIQLFINFSALYYQVLVYILRDAAIYACSRLSCGLTVCFVVVEKGFDNANGFPSLEPLNIHIVCPEQPLNPHPNSLFLPFGYWARAYVHSRTVTFVLSLICDNFLEIWEL